MKNIQQKIGWILQEKYGGKMTAAAKRDIERLKKGEPLDHIIGFVEFLNCKILVNGNVLIPRVETELMTERGIDELSSYKVHKVLDIFAGSGAIGIAVLKNIKNARVTFAESEKGALSQIKKNCKINKVPFNKYEIIESDMFLRIGGKFDFIFANPPYIPAKNISKVQKSVLLYEPKPALFGGTDGLKYIRKFLAAAKNFLNPGGKIYMEFDPPQKPAIEKLLKKYGYKIWQFHKDQFHKWRYVVVL